MPMDNLLLYLLMLKTLEEFGAGSAFMAGQITPRRLFKGLHPDLKATRILLSLKRRNAETIFGAIAEILVWQGRFSGKCI